MVDNNKKTFIRKKDFWKLTETERKLKAKELIDKLRTFKRMVLIEKLPISNKNPLLNDAGYYHSKFGYPAKVLRNGTLEWYKNGALHRENDLPAIIKSNGALEWFINGKLRRSNMKLPIRISFLNTLYVNSVGLKYGYEEVEWIQKTSIDSVIIDLLE